MKTREQIINSTEDLKEIMSKGEQRFSKMDTPEYPKDYEERELYKEYSTVIRSEFPALRGEHHRQHGGLLPDFGCDTANSTYLEVLAALDYAEDIMSMNCDDYSYNDHDKDFDNIRNSLLNRINAGIKSSAVTWQKRKEETA